MSIKYYWRDRVLRETGYSDVIDGGTVYSLVLDSGVNHELVLAQFIDDLEHAVDFAECETSWYTPNTVLVHVRREALLSIACKVEG